MNKQIVQSEIDVNDNNIKLNNSAISQIKILENDKSIKELEILNKNFCCICRYKC